MAKTREDYEALGRKNAQSDYKGTGDWLSHPFPRTNTSWQSRAYWLGWDHEVILLQNNCASVPDVKVSAGPQLEHLRCLNQILRAPVLNAKRLRRIKAKILIMEDRLGLL